VHSPGRPSGSGFRALFVGSLISNTGDGIRLAALPLLAAQLISSPVLVGAVTAAQFLPWVSVAPLGGALVDRHDRRRMILVNQAWRGAVMITLAWSVANDLVLIWRLCVVAFVISAGEILVDPSVVALVPTLVDDEQLDTANGRIASAEVVTNDFAGGPAGAVAFGLAPWLPFALDAGSYLASLVPFRRLPSDPPPTEDRSNDLRPGAQPTLLSVRRRGPPIPQATPNARAGHPRNDGVLPRGSHRVQPARPPRPPPRRWPRMVVRRRARLWCHRRIRRDARRRQAFTTIRHASRLGECDGTGGSRACRNGAHNIRRCPRCNLVPWRAADRSSHPRSPIAASSSSARSPAAPSRAPSVSVGPSLPEVPSRSSLRS